jgi:hypothetical protein
VADAVPVSFWKGAKMRQNHQDPIEHIELDEEKMDDTDRKLKNILDEIEAETDDSKAGMFALGLEESKEIVTNTRVLGTPSPRIGLPLGREGLKSGNNGTGHKKEPLYREVTSKPTLVPLPDGALSVEADEVPKENRIYVFE